MFTAGSLARLFRLVFRCLTSRADIAAPAGIRRRFAATYRIQA